MVAFGFCPKIFGGGDFPQLVSASSHTSHLVRLSLPNIFFSLALVKPLPAFGGRLGSLRV